MNVASERRCVLPETPRQQVPEGALLSDPCSAFITVENTGVTHMKSTRICQSAGRTPDNRQQRANPFTSTGMFILVLAVCPVVLSNAQQPTYLNSSKPVRQRVDDLLWRMTLEEEIGQMNMPCSYLRRMLNGVFHL